MREEEEQEDERERVELPATRNVCRLHLHRRSGDPERGTGLSS